MRHSLRLKILHAIYSFHQELLARWSISCQPGCSDCCTRSVTMTGLEGDYLLAHLRLRQEMAILEDALATSPAGRPSLTTNQFAAACLQGRDLVAEAEGWDLAPCPLLANNRCRVYAARPFGCRALASLTSCHATGAAITPPLLLSANIMLVQVIEHLDRGGIWGNMLEVVRCLATPADQPAARQYDLLINQACPGFLFGPEEEQELRSLQRELFRLPVAGRSLGEYLGADAGQH